MRLLRVPFLIELEIIIELLLGKMERVLKLIAYYLYVAESKMKVFTEEKENYSIKVALLRDIYDDIKAMDVENEVKYGRERKRVNKWL